MSDAFHYFLSLAIEAARKARKLPSGRARDKPRTVARI
jgi:hypothetical protein